MMRKSSVAFLLAMVIGIAAAQMAFAKDKGETGRLLTGRVMDKQDQPVGDAVVYLSDTRSRVVKTFIVGPDGSYRFPALSRNVDYEVYAQFNGHKSDTKTISQFDDRGQVTVNLRIDLK